MKRENGVLTFVIGRSGSGKTIYTMRKIQAEKFDRILVWDADYQYCELLGFTKVSGWEMLDYYMSLDKPIKIAYQPKDYKEDFQYFCDQAFLWAMENPCAIVVEEIADVVSPGKATDGWGVMVRRLRKYGAHTYACTQRPAETDKSTLGNAQSMVIFAPNTEMDAEYLVKKVGIDPAKIPTENTHYLVRDMNGNTKAGRLTF